MPPKLRSHSHDMSSTPTMTTPVKQRSAWIQRQSLTGLHHLSMIPSHSPWSPNEGKDDEADGELEGGLRSSSEGSSSSTLGSPILMQSPFSHAMPLPQGPSLSKPVLSLLSLLSGVFLTLTFLSSGQSRGEAGFSVQPALNWTSASQANLSIEALPIEAPVPVAAVEPVVEVTAEAPAAPVKAASGASCESQRKIHVVVPATSSSGAFCRTLATMSLNEYDPVILNWQGAQAHSAKIFTMDQYLRQSTSATRELEEDGREGALCGPEERQDIVLMTDAYDVWAQEPLDHLISKFLASNKRIIFSADKACFPDLEACQQVPDSEWPPDIYGPETDRLVGPDSNFPTRTRPRWLNSGFVVGFAKDLAVLYRDAAAEAKRLEAGPGLLYDQAVFQPLFASKRYNVSLDYGFDLVQPYFWNEEDLFYAPLSEAPSSLSSTLLNGRTPWMIHNRITHSRPSMVHFQFWKKPMDVEWPRMWWAGQAGRTVAERVNAYLWSKGGAKLPDGRWMDWQELCGQPGRWDMPDPRRSPEAMLEFQLTNARAKASDTDKEPMPPGLHFAPPFPPEAVVDQVELPPVTPPQEAVKLKPPGEMMLPRPPAEGMLHRPPAEGALPRPPSEGMQPKRPSELPEQRKLQRVQRPRPKVR